MNVLVIVGQAHWAQCGIAPLVLLRTGTGIAAVRGHAVQNSTIDAIMHWAVRVRAVQNRPTRCNDKGRGEAEREGGED